MGFGVRPSLGDDLGQHFGHLGPTWASLVEMEIAICPPRNISWIYEIVYIKDPARTWHSVDVPKTEATVLLGD